MRKGDAGDKLMDWIAYLLVIFMFFLSVGGIIFKQSMFDKLIYTGFAGICVYVIYKASPWNNLWWSKK